MDDVRRRSRGAELEEVLELLGGHRISAPALGQVEVEGVDVAGRDALHDGPEARQPERARRQVDHRARAVRAEGPLVEVAHERLRRGAARAGGPLDAGDSADERAHLGVAGLSLRRDLGQQDVLRVADEGLVGRGPTPRVAVGVELRRLPRGEDVELRVPVQVEQAGQDDTVGLEHGDVGRFALGDAVDHAVGDGDVAARPRPVGRDDGAVQRERRRWERPGATGRFGQLLGDAAVVRLANGVPPVGVTVPATCGLPSARRR